MSSAKVGNYIQAQYKVNWTKKQTPVQLDIHLDMGHVTLLVPHLQLTCSDLTKMIRDQCTSYGHQGDMPNSVNTSAEEPMAESGLILGFRPANERRRYKVTPSLIGWAQI